MILKNLSKENEYPNYIKIACHGCFGSPIDPDKRDENCDSDRKKAIERSLKLISKVFPDALETDNGPAIEETCIYSVCYFFIIYIFNMILYNYK